MEQFKILDGSKLKMIAIITMLIDHVAGAFILRAVLEPNAPLTMDSVYYTWYQAYQVMRAIGRIAFPIFCFLLVEGFKYTKSRRKYAIRLLLFALLSEVPFDLAFFGRMYWDHQNVYWTLLIGLVMMWGITYLEDAFASKVSSPILSSWRGNRLLLRLMQLAVAGGTCGVAYVMKTDYDYRGILLILALFIFRYTRVEQTIAGALTMYWEWPAVIPSFLLMHLYNGRRGRGGKYFFYVFYPLHLLLLFLLTCLFQNRI